MRNYQALSLLSPFELKNQLLQVAGPKVLNAGRGNPNFFNKFVRDAFSHLQLITLRLSSVLAKGELNIYPAESEYNYYPELKKLINKDIADKKIADFLIYYLDFLKKHAETNKIPSNQIFHDVVLSAIGSFYPSPPRIQPHLSLICQEYIYHNVFRNTKTKLKTQDFEYFACEGAAAGIMYVFNTLHYNQLMKKGDKCAIMTPIFSPYLEMPKLDVYGLKTVILKGDPEKNFQVSNQDLDKLKDPKVKVLFMVNPENPSDFTVTQENVKYIKHIVDKYNKDLIIVTDDVYSPFVMTYNSLMKSCPDNTILIQSLSKYFGVTGWRLGIIMTKKKNRIDQILRKNNSLHIRSRYGIASTEPSQLTLMDRLVLDSRQVAGGHVAGLSTPQQLILGMFLMWDYRDKRRVYQKIVIKLLQDRMKLLYQPLKIKPTIAPNETNYYTLLDILELTEAIAGKKAKDKMKKRNPLEFLFHLAEKYHTVLLPGQGFGTSPWKLRASIANLDTLLYSQIGENIKKTILDLA